MFAQLWFGDEYKRLKMFCKTTTSPRALHSYNFREIWDEWAWTNFKTDIIPVRFNWNKKEPQEDETQELTANRIESKQIRIYTPRSPYAAGIDI